MSQSRRVIITGTNKAGKSVVAEDVHAALTGPGNFDFWQTKPGQSPHDLSFGRSPMKFYPQPGGTMFRLFTIPPDDPNTNLDVGLPKPRENDVSICGTLSRSPLVGGVAGASRASRTAELTASSDPPVAALP